MTLHHMINGGYVAFDGKTCWAYDHNGKTLPGFENYPYALTEDQMNSALHTECLCAMKKESNAS